MQEKNVMVLTVGVMKCNHAQKTLKASTKLFITADLMQFFLNNVAKYQEAAVLSVFIPVESITCRVGDQGSLNGVNFEIIKGKEKVYQGIEMFQTYFDE